MDHGQPLRFGVRVAAGTAGEEAVARAALAEELGLDVVLVAEEPSGDAGEDADAPGRDGGAGLDAWTVLSWVAARTSRIGIAAGPLDAAARPPAVLARAAASLDLLTGGRLELGLRAAGRWDPREGARGLPPGEAAAALGEAVAVVRGMWAAGERSPLRFAGEHHQVPAAERGPAPAHNVPVWVAGADPGVLRLAGATADGWLTGLDEAPSLEHAQALVDEAATSAGRDPREIRRIVLLPARSARPVRLLAGLALERGIDTFVLDAPSDAALREFAERTVPALREAVARERAARGTAAAPVVSRQVRAARHRGIDYDAVPAHLERVEPGDAGYARVRSTYMRGGSPGLVLRPGTPAEVADALAFARTQPVKLGIRSGGHGISGRSTNHGGIVLDVSRLNGIEVLDKATRRVRLGPGARWSDVAAALAPYGWALSSGDHGGVGVGGLATAGGIGWLVREHGLTIDHLRAAELVLADGSRVRADEHENADLFWGVRGAGANFGVVTSFEFEVDEVGDVGFAQFVMDASDPAALLHAWGAAVEAAPRDVTSALILGGARPGQPLMAQVMTVVDAGDAETVLARLRPIAEVAPLLDHRIQILPYAALMDVPPHPHDGQGEPVGRSALADHLTPELAEAAARLVRSGATYFFHIRSAGGAVADVPRDATAYAGRSANFSLAAFGSARARLDPLWDAMRPHFSGLYLNFETDTRPERLLDAFPEPTLSRLRALKRRYDPGNVFRDNFPLTP
ncbi:LLM class flavin-dependent oxidoreductase [Actinomadura sp. ATCC 31491]|uniref:LLM class flavin-dependent oxidoreductase n=1 Tax=Actinomadura luzonensis TaxID=2805427 RepID=A0ABT0G9S4_9ACTN|nr:LLM class flavin-dependent oxidoreductase [Actinomadura luzonensis]MCK2220980.1 LLM class flavin-dependent oxidoreductase [Actinomadura luzonensis]